jgi:hypothetical protein
LTYILIYAYYVFIHIRKRGPNLLGKPERNWKMSKERNHSEGVSTKYLERGIRPQDTAQRMIKPKTRCQG